MKKSLVLLITVCLSFVSMLIMPKPVGGQDIQLVSTIRVDPMAKLKSTPDSFCVTEDKIFLIPDYHSGKVKLLSENKNSLNYIKELGSDDIGKERMLNPTYCFYNQKVGRLGVIDDGARWLFIFARNGKVDFKLVKNIECKMLGYDIDFSGDGKQLIISGNVSDKGNMGFGLYSINLETGNIDYLLPSYQKYNLENDAKYRLEYYTNQTLPAIGIKAFFDISGDEIFFVWEGKLRIIRINIRSKTTMLFGHETKFYTKPDGARLAGYYKKEDFGTAFAKRKEYTYVRNIFSTSMHVFVVYETAKSASMFRLQTYTLDGKYLSDILIPGKPGHQMWFDKEKHELYALAQDGNVKGKYEILKYGLKIK